MRTVARNQNGFTLVELLLVVIVLAILAAIVDVYKSDGVTSAGGCGGL